MSTEIISDVRKVKGNYERRERAGALEVEIRIGYRWYKGGNEKMSVGMTLTGEGSLRL